MRSTRTTIVRPLREGVAATTAGAPGELLAHEAFEQVREELGALADDDLLPVNVGLGRACGLGMAMYARIMSLREEMAALPGLDLRAIERVDRYALACLWAHAAYLATTTEGPPISELVARGKPLYEILKADLIALIRRGLVNEKVLRGLRKGKGHAKLGQNLVTLSALFGEDGSLTAPHSGVTEREIASAQELGYQLLLGIERRRRRPPELLEAKLNRQRAFTLFARAYGQARRAVLYLRYEEGDADRFAPSLYGGREVPKQKRTRGPKRSLAHASAAPPVAPALPSSAAAPTVSAASAAPVR